MCFLRRFVAFCAPNVIWLHSFMNRQYDRGPPIKILHKYPERRSSIQLELKLFGGMRSLRDSHLCVFSGVLLRCILCAKRDLVAQFHEQAV